MRKGTLITIVLLLTVGLTAGCGKKLNPEVRTALQAMDREYDRMFAWWATIYDSASGGFYYSQSSKNNPAYGPDIEATQKAVQVLNWMHALDRTPAGFREGVVRFFRERQDSASGFFYNPQHRERYTGRMRSRALGMSSSSLRKCGGEPAYPLPRERISENEEARKYYEHLQSAAAFKTWLDGLPWYRTWSAGELIRTQSGHLQKLSEPLRSEILDTLLAYVSRRQQPGGEFGTEKWFSVLSGTYKIAATLDQNGLTIPRVEELAASTLYRLNNEPYNNLIVLYNTANLLSILQRHGSGFTPAQQVEIITTFTEKLKAFHAPDHGFLTHTDKPAAVCNGILMADEVMEGNTNATGLAVKSRIKLYEMALGPEEAVPPHPRTDDFIRALKAYYPTEE